MSIIKCAHKHYANYLILICLPNPCNCKYTTTVRDQKYFDTMIGADNVFDN